MPRNTEAITDCSYCWLLAHSVLYPFIPYTVDDLEPNFFGGGNNNFYLVRSWVGTQKKSLARSFGRVRTDSGVRKVSSELLLKSFQDNTLSLLLAQTYVYLEQVVTFLCDKLSSPSHLLWGRLCIILLGSDELHKAISLPFLKQESNCCVMNKGSHFLVHIWSHPAVSPVSLRLLEEHSSEVCILIWHGAWSWLTLPLTLHQQGCPVPYLGPWKLWTVTETFEMCCIFLVLPQTFAAFSRMSLLLFVQLFFF